MGMMDDMEKDVFEIEEDRIEEEEKKSKKKAGKKSKKLQKEYESAFDGEEKMMHKLANIKSDIDVYAKDIEIESIITSNFNIRSLDVSNFNLVTYHKISFHICVF